MVHVSLACAEMGKRCACLGGESGGSGAPRIAHRLRPIQTLSCVVTWVDPPCARCLTDPRALGLSRQDQRCGTCRGPRYWDPLLKHHPPLPLVPITTFGLTIIRTWLK